MAKGYTVTHQRQTTELTPGAGFTDVMEVSFRTEGGTVGTVRVPLSRYSADEVATAIEAYVVHIQAVENL